MPGHRTHRPWPVAALLALALALPASPAAAGPADSRPGQTFLVSRPGLGRLANDYSVQPSVSADGRVVAFTSVATNLVHGDTNGFADIFVADRVTGAIERVSVASDGTQADSLSGYPAISPDGRYVAFYSLATTLMNPQTLSGAHVYLHDRATRTTTVLTARPDGTPVGGGGFYSQSRPALTAGATQIAFSTNAALLPGDANTRFDIYLVDRTTGRLERISVSSTGGDTSTGGLGSAMPSLSADGRYVAFESDASNIVPGDTNGTSNSGIGRDIFVRDRQTQTTERVSVSSTGIEANGASTMPSISADGRVIAFDSLASNLVASDSRMNTRDVFVRDLVTRRTRRISVGPRGEEVGSGANLEAKISADGRRVAFVTSSWELLGTASDDGAYGVVVHDLVEGVARAASVSGFGDHANRQAFALSATGDLRYVAFQSEASNLVPDDDNGKADVFVHDTGMPIGIGALRATRTGSEIEVAGWVTSRTVEVASAVDPADDGAAGAAQLGGEIVDAYISYRPARGDLLARVGVASLPSVFGRQTGFGYPPSAAVSAGVIHGFEFQLRDTLYQVRVLRFLGDDPTQPMYGLFRCTAEFCTEEHHLGGGYGTTGHEIVVSLPLSVLNVRGGDELRGFRAFTAANVSPDIRYAERPLDGLSLGDIVIPTREVRVGVVPRGESDQPQGGSVVATVVGGWLTATLDASALAPGQHDAWARVCLATTCRSERAPVARSD